MIQGPILNWEPLTKCFVVQPHDTDPIELENVESDAHGQSWESRPIQ